jgi:hypothetical protein
VSATQTDLPALAEGVVDEFKSSTSWQVMSQRSRDALDDVSASIKDRAESLRQLDRDLAELNSKRDLIPRQGFERLESEARAEAQRRSDEAGARFDRAHKELKEALIDDALPVYDSGREGMARQELALVIGDAQGTAARKRALDLVQSGSSEATAILLRTSFGRTLLESRGVKGRDLQEFFTSARTIAAGLAAERGQTDRERAARAALSQVAGLGAAKGATGVRRW